MNREDEHHNELNLNPAPTFYTSESTKYYNKSKVIKICVIIHLLHLNADKFDCFSKNLLNAPGAHVFPGAVVGNH